MVCYIARMCTIRNNNNRNIHFQIKVRVYIKGQIPSPWCWSQGDHATSYGEWGGVRGEGYGRVAWDSCHPDWLQARVLGPDPRGTDPELPDPPCNSTLTQQSPPLLPSPSRIKSSSEKSVNPRINDSGSLKQRSNELVILDWDEWNAQLTWYSQLWFVSRGRWVSGSRSLRKTRPPRPVLGGGSVTLPGTRVILTEGTGSGSGSKRNGSGVTCDYTASYLIFAITPSNEYSLKLSFYFGFRIGFLVESTLNKVYYKDSPESILSKYTYFCKNRK